MAQKHNVKEANQLNFSKLALGTWPISGAREWGSFDENNALNILKEARASGINCFDTAPIYGLNQAENILGKFIKTENRDNLIITSKCGLTQGKRAVNFDLSAKAISLELEATLRRLNTEYLDIYFLHWPDKNTPLEETLTQMEKFKKEGKIRFIGLSNFTKNLIEESIKITEIDCLQNEFSFINQKAKELFPLINKHHLFFMSYGSLGGGILSGKYKTEPILSKNDVKSFFYKYYKGASFEQSQKAIKILEHIEKYPLSQIALNWVCAHPEVSCAIFGAKNNAQLQQNIGAFMWSLTDKEKYLLDNLYERTFN